MLPGLSRDVVTIQRPASSADTEGNWSSTLSAPTTLMGAWGRASDSETQAAGTRGDIIDSVVALPAGTVVAPGDRVTVMGDTWVCVGTRELRTHMRVLLRQTT